MTVPTHELATFISVAANCYGTSPVVTVSADTGLEQFSFGWQFSSNLINSSDMIRSSYSPFGKLVICFDLAELVPFWLKNDLNGGLLYFLFGIGS